MVTVISIGSILLRVGIVNEELCHARFYADGQMPREYPALVCGKRDRVDHEDLYGHEFEGPHHYSEYEDWAR